MADILAIPDRLGRGWAAGSDSGIAISPGIRDVFHRADRAAAVTSPVLITGESGTGKEVLARRIHQASDRRRGPFVPINCGSIPDTLIETELFGHTKGAFTGAFAAKRGLVEEAGGGVLFLDEIGDMPLPMQVRLLRFLDSGEIRVVGGTSVAHVDVRVVAATNRDLRAEIRERRFREDLFFRLSVIALHLPPLRERRADIPALVAYHVPRLAQRLRVPVPEVSDPAMSYLLQYDWPGNVRELQNALEHALVQASGVVRPEDLPEQVRCASRRAGASARDDDDTADRLVSALVRHNGHHSNAAAALGISRTTLWRRLRHLNAVAGL